MAKVVLDYYVNEEYDKSVELDGVATVGVYGASGSAVYTVKDDEAKVVVRFTGSFNPEDGEPQEVTSKSVKGGPEPEPQPEPTPEPEKATAATKK